MVRGYIQAVFENIIGATVESINAPFMVGKNVIGIIKDVTDETFTVWIFDRFLGVERSGNKPEPWVSAVYLQGDEIPFLQRGTLYNDVE